ncbi:hypothetical protein SLS58_010207 [Diplodia intermedia]|uniref:Uncharacterized protein n=1 Tax=Diplodia intermedia TaxID=856260 RepID=A0ABR3T7L2_9PEZI
MPQDFSSLRIDIAKTTYSSLPSSSSCASYATVRDGPACTGCVLEAIQPEQLTFPGEIVHLTQTIIHYATVYLENCTSYNGCTSYSVSTVPVSCAWCDGGIATKEADITWTWNQATLTYPTTYLGYDCLQLATWTQNPAADDSTCTLGPTPIAAYHVPFAYPATAPSEPYMPVPAPIVEFLRHDPNVSLPFDIATCTARPPLPATCTPAYPAADATTTRFGSPLVDQAARDSLRASSTSPWSAGGSPHYKVVGLVDGSELVSLTATVSGGGEASAWTSGRPSEMTQTTTTTSESRSDDGSVRSTTTATRTETESSSSSGTGSGSGSGSQTSAESLLTGSV